MPGLEIRNLTASFPADKGRHEPVLKDFSLTIDEGSLVSVIGPVGSGKTTLLRTIAGLHHPDQGEILWNSQPLPNDLKSRSRHLAHLPSDTALFPHLTVRQNLELPVNWQKASGREVKDAVDQIITDFDLEALLERRPDELSSGQRQTAGLARSLVTSPSILLLDEPLSNCDRNSRFHLIQKIRNICSRNQTTLVMVTHHQEEAFALDDQIALMRDGRIEQSSPAQTIYQQPKCRFAATFVGRHPMNLLNGCLQFANGETSFLPKGASCPIRIEPGQFPESLPRADEPIVLGIRCEDVDSTVATDQTGFPCQSHRFIGDGWLNSIALPQPVEIQTAERIPAGSRVGLTFRPQQIVVFPRSEA